MIKYEEHFGINIISTNLNNSTNVDFLTEDIVNDVEKFHTSIDEYKKTPLVKLDNLASKLGVKNIFVKDESYRYGLNAFKGLGGLYAIFMETMVKVSLGLLTNLVANLLYLCLKAACLQEQRRLKVWAILQLQLLI